MVDGGWWIVDSRCGKTVKCINIKFFLGKMECSRLRHCQKIKWNQHSTWTRYKSIKVNLCRTYAFDFGFLSLVWCEIYMFGCGFMVHFSLMGALKYKSNALETQDENKFPFYDVLTHAFGGFSYEFLSFYLSVSKSITKCISTLNKVFFFFFWKPCT